MLKLFTQNIDCLEREAGVPDQKIVEAHGSFARQRCIECKSSYPDDLMRISVERSDVPHCRTPQCNGLVKPDIVFFGEQLPEEFHRNRSLPAAADLCIIMGTSLTVQPFASLPAICSEGVPRLLINKERVGGLGSRSDDVLLLGDCDVGVRQLASALGWLQELEALWHQTNPEEKPVADVQEMKSKDELLEDEIDKLTADVDTSLKLSNDHTAWLRDHLDKKHNKISASDGPSGVQPRHEGDESGKASVTFSGGTFQVGVPNGAYSHQDNSNRSENDEEESRLNHVFPHITTKPSL